jgi:hypothetical protein
LFAIFLSGNVFAKEAVTMGVILFPPDVTLDEKTKECVGRNITITRALLAKYDFSLNVVCASPLRIYRMIEDGEIDFTINIKSPVALADYVVFTDIPFRQIRLNLYTHINGKEGETISAVRGFDYQGYRQKFENEGYEFIDLSSTISAIQVFIKHRSHYMLSYQSPVDNYLINNDLNIKDTVSSKSLMVIDTYYAISNQSAHLEALLRAFNHFKAEHKLKYFLDGKDML